MASPSPINCVAVSVSTFEAGGPLTVTVLLPVGGVLVATDKPGKAPCCAPAQGGGKARGKKARRPVTYEETLSPPNGRQVTAFSGTLATP